MHTMREAGTRKYQSNCLRSVGISIGSKFLVMVQDNNNFVYRLASRKTQLLVFNKAQ